MNDVLVRLLIVGALVLVAAGVAAIASRYRRPPHPDITVGEVGDRPGVVLFTSTTCPTCKQVIATLEDMAVPFREVTHDLEPQRFESWGVVAVPVTVVIDESSQVVQAFSGVPRRRPLRRALDRAGLS